MGNALINFTQGVSTGGAGFALIGVTGTPVTVSNGDDSEIVNYQFTMVDVGVGSAITQGVVQNGDTPTYTFTPDASGCYVLNLITTDNQGNLYQDTRVFGILETSGRLIPSYLGTDKAMNFVISSVENLKGWSPFLQAYLKQVDMGGGGGSFTTYTQDCSAGGTITYAGPTPVADQVILIGTPSTDFTYEMPNGPWVTMFANAVTGASVGAFVVTQHLPGSGTTVGFSQTTQLCASTPTSYAQPTGVGYYTGDVVPFNDETGWEQGVQSIAHTNQFAPATSYVPIYGPVMGPLDSATYGITPPEAEGAPAGFSGLGVGTYYEFNFGYYGTDTSGVTVVLVPNAQYPTTAWSTQMMLVGGYGGPAVGGPIGTTITGKATFSTFQDAPTQYTTPSGNSTTRVTYVLQARIIASDTADDTFGDRVTITQDFDLDVINGVLFATAVSSQVKTSKIQVGGGTLASGIVFSVVSNSATLTVTVDTTGCTTFDGGVQVDLAIWTDRSLTT